MPKVSVILTSHNRPAMLKEAMDSILNQTLKDIELIIIDDYSTMDGVLPLLKEVKRDQRVKVYRTNYDVDNIAVLWNLAIDRSTGEYIAFLDDDNMKELAFCEKMSKYLNKNLDCDAVACFANIINKLNGKTSVFDKPKEMTRYNIIYGNYVDSGVMMFRHQVIDKIGWFDERLKTAEDWDYVKRIVLQTKGFGIIEEPLTYYRWHKENRMYRSDSLGFKIHKDFITNRKNYNKVLNVLFFHQDRENLTLSQNNVLQGILDALNNIEFVKVEDMSVAQIQSLNKYYDIVFCFAPFSMDTIYIKTIQMYGSEQIHFHCEDPQALGINYDRAKYATYVFTNDVSVMDKYQEVVGKGNVGYCPSISLNDVSLKFKDNLNRKNDVVFLGYPYDSRIEFVKEFKKEFKNTGYRLILLGDTWKDKGIGLPCLDTLSEQETMRLLENTKIVILYNRRNTDLGGGVDSIKPQSPVRGYFECGSGALVMLDEERPHHSYNQEIVLYSGVEDLVKKIDYYMRKPEERTKIGRIAKQRALRDWTYRVRIRKLLNAVRSKRYYYEVS